MRWDTLALGFMTLALFLGGGNIICPPCVGKFTGGNYLIASGGFIFSGVLLPVLPVLIYLACTVTAVGLTSSTASQFSQMLKVKYPVMLALVVFCSFLLANFGLTRLIAFSVPALSVICPACTTLIVLPLLRVPEKAIARQVWVSIIFSFNDAVLIPFGPGLPFSDKIPLSDVSLSWLFPAVVAVLIACIRLRLNEKLKPETHCL